MEPMSERISDEASYEDALELLEKQLYKGVRVTPEWKALQKAAALKDENRDIVAESQTTANDVVNDLQERNPGIPPWAFQPGMADKKQWTGMREEWVKNTEFDEDDWDDRGRLVE